MEQTGLGPFKGLLGNLGRWHVSVSYKDKAVENCCALTVYRYRYRCRYGYRDADAGAVTGVDVAVDINPDTNTDTDIHTDIAVDLIQIRVVVLARVSRCCTRLPNFTD